MGKALDIKSRVTNHFKTYRQNSKEQRLISQVKKIDHIVVSSELEALLLEASLIKKHQPFFNTRAKDDKHPLYIRITMQDEFPRVFTARREDESGAIYFGPFPSSRTVKQVLHFLRTIFPFDTQKKIGKRTCFWSHLGLCQPCPSLIMTKQGREQIQLKRLYQKNIARLIAVLSRRSSQVRQTLSQEMTKFAREESFEQAAKIRDQISKLDYITQPRLKIADFLENPNFMSKIRQDESKNLYQLLRKYLSLTDIPQRIECFDASHTAMTLPTVGMVTFIGAEPAKNFYRRFRIKQKSFDDLSFLEEALTRRFTHPDWGKPDLLVVDGGKTQVATAQRVLRQFDINIPIIGLVKPFDNVVIPKKEGLFILSFKTQPGFHLLQRLRDEAHRFARSYHRKLRSKAVFI